MRHELLINGQKVDMGNDNVYLSYKSNILGRIDSIVSSHSYTIKLPKTSRNLKLIECADIPSSKSQFVVTKQKAQLLRDGIIIVEKATVVLLEIDSDIQISLTWGSFPHLAKLLKGKRKLREMPYGDVEGTDYTPWVLNSVNCPIAYYKIAPANTRIPGYINTGDRPPVISVNDILQRIAKDTGIEITSNIGNDVVLPILSFMPNPLDIERGKCNLNSANIIPSGQFKGKVSLPTFNNEFINIASASGEYESETSGSISPKYEFVKLRMGLYAKFRVMSNITVTHIDFYKGRKEEKNKIESIAPELRHDTNDVLHAYFQCEIEVEDYSFVQLYMETNSNLALEEFDLYIENIPVRILPKNSTTSYKRYNKLYYNINLPDITQIEFLQSIIEIFGLFVRPTQKGIRLLRFKDAIDKNVAVDWSNKLTHELSYARAIEYRLQSVAQHNYYKYKPDDNISGNYDSEITVSNETLDYEKIAVSSIYAACDSYITNNEGRRVYCIPLYDKDGNPKEGTAPRIMIMRDNRLVFKTWTELITENYSEYAAFIQAPKMITEEVRLTAIDLKNINLNSPIYLRQYGSYFALIEVRTTNTEVCKVKLLKI